MKNTLLILLVASQVLLAPGCSSNLTSTEAEGLPSFPIGVWLQGPLRERNGKNNAQNYKDLGVNVFIGLWQWPDESWAYPGYSLQVAMALKDSGMKAFAGDSVAAADWNSAHPEYASTFLGYVLGDEPDMNKLSGDQTVAAQAMPDAWLAAGRALKAADPTRPIYANFGKGFALDPWPGYKVDPGPDKASDFAKYMDSLDVISSDYYAITDPYESLKMHGIWGYGRAVRNTIKLAGSRPVIGFVEASAPFSDGKNENNIASPMPPSMLKPAVWAMIVSGAKGIIYFCHDFSNGGMVEDGCLANPNMAAAMKATNESVLKYGSVLLSTESTGATVSVQSSSPVMVLLKQYKGTHYLFAMGDSNCAWPNGKAVDANFAIEGVALQSTYVSLPEELRSLIMRNGIFEDHFEPYQVHIYEF